MYATLSMTGTPFAVAISSDRVVYVTQVHAGSLARVDLEAATIDDVIPVGVHPSQVRVGPSGRVYVGNQDTPSVGVVDVATPTQVASFPLTQSVLTIGLSTLADGKVFVLDRTSRAVARVITTGGSPRYISFDATGSRAVIANESGWVTFVR